MDDIKVDAPFKVLIKDIINFEKSESCWVFKDGGKNIVINKIHIQGAIIKTAGFSNEILIIDDGTGKAKVTRGSNTPGDLSWINTGIYCSVVGTLLEKGKLPHITSNKLAKISNEILKEMWPLEANELKNLLTNKILLRLPEDNMLN